MNFLIRTVLHYLQHSHAYDPKSSDTLRKARQLAKDPQLQHLIRRLQQQLSHKLSQQPAGLKIMDRSLPARTRLLKKRTAAKTFKAMQRPPLEVRFRVPNITAGKTFSEKITALETLDGILEMCAYQSDADLQGLTINSGNFTIEGLLNTSGTLEIRLFCILLLPDGDRQTVNGRLNISIIPDPRSLWKNLPSDSEALFHKADQDCDACRNASTTLISASIRGRSHAHKGTHRDDDSRIAISDTGWNILCVADGAGSCQYSRRGSQLAVLHAVDVLKEALDGHYGQALEQLISTPSADNQTTLGEIYQQTLVKAVYQAARAIQSEADKHKANFKDFSSTLLLAAHKPIEDGHLILSFWVGDGAAVIYDQQQITVLGQPDSGQYAGQTRFLDHALFDDGSIYDRIKLQKVPSMTALILLTDGVSDARFDTEQQLSEQSCWDDLWSELQALIQHEDLPQSQHDLSQWLNFWSAGNHDDRSIAIAYVEE